MKKFNFTVGALFAAYLSMMIGYPLITSNGSLVSLMSTWHSWQTLNAAMIAFVASIIAVYAVRYQDNANRKRKQNAAKALLPNALSELREYLESLSLLLIDLNEKLRAAESDIYIDQDIPSIPDWVNEVLKECVEYSDSQESSYITKLLSYLQVAKARIKGLRKPDNPKHTILISVNTIENRMLDLLIVTVKVHRLFPYARENKDLYLGEITKEELITALTNLHCNEGNFPSIFDRVNMEDFKLWTPL